MTIGDTDVALLLSDGLRDEALERALQQVTASIARQACETTDFLGSVRDVVVVASASRSGSSLFAELLKLSPRFLHCCGEINPFLRLAGLGWPASGTDSDALTESHCTSATRRIVGAHLAAEIGFVAADDASKPISEDFAESLYRRLCVQWPLDRFTIDEVRRAATFAVGSVEQTVGEPIDWSRDLGRFHLVFLAALMSAHPAINPYYYDIDRELIRAELPEIPVPAGPPSPVIIEEPPFILIRPWTRWQVADLTSRALVVKTPSNAYRFDFLAALFPKARLHVLHLTRNPAAAVNGMCDGWRHWGFHSGYVGSDLRVPGYSEPDLPDFGWWKFDLPPGWQEYRTAPLVQICAYQWRAAQLAIMNLRGRSDIDYRQVRIEDLLLALAEGRDTVDDLCEWLGDEQLLRRMTGGLPHVMSTKPPRPGRWRDNARELAPVLRDRSVRQVAGELGYKDEATWI